MWNANGILIQGINEKTNFVKSFPYLGLNAYFSYPLMSIKDVECRKLSNEQLSKEIEENRYVSLEYISNADLYTRYLKKCKELEIDVRVLFVESEYCDEIWKEELPKMKFLGYEYCSIPIDEQIITDMDWYEPFSCCRKKLNEYGLFDLYEDVLEFVNVYNKAVNEGEVGDGEMDAYICKVFQITT
ncbi:MAG: hypothetical protein J6B96_08735 [Agathobacter sp.]|nr:hypothetical protein [Agathobacter sp.]